MEQHLPYRINKAAQTILFYPQNQEQQQELLEVFSVKTTYETLAEHYSEKIPIDVPSENIIQVGKSKIHYPLSKQQTTTERNSELAATLRKKEVFDLLANQDINLQRATEEEIPIIFQHFPEKSIVYFETPHQYRTIHQAFGKEKPYLKYKEEILNARRGIRYDMQNMNVELTRGHMIFKNFIFRNDNIQERVELALESVQEQGIQVKSNYALPEKNTPNKLERIMDRLRINYLHFNN